MANETGYDGIYLGRATEQELRSNISKIKTNEVVVAKDTFKSFFKGEDGLLHSIVPDQDLTVLETGIAETKTEITKVENGVLGSENEGTIEDGTLHQVGEIWYSSANRKYYKCLIENSLDYAESTVFEAISNNDLLDKVNNLFDNYSILHDSYFNSPTPLTINGLKDCSVIQVTTGNGLNAAETRTIFRCGASSKYVTCIDQSGYATFLIDFENEQISTYHVAGIYTEGNYITKIEKIL